MKEFELVLKLRNNLLKSRRLEFGFKTQREAADAIGISQAQFCALETMRRSPKDTVGEWRSSALKIAQFFGATPEDIWPDVVLAVKQPELVREIGAQEVAALSGMKAVVELPPRPDEELARLRDVESVRSALKFLSQREREVIELRYGLKLGTSELSFPEIADLFGVTTSRIHQIHNHAQRKLRKAFVGQWTCGCGKTHLKETTYWCYACKSTAPFGYRDAETFDAF